MTPLGQQSEAVAQCAHVLVMVDQLSRAPVASRVPDADGLRLKRDPLPGSPRTAAAQFEISGLKFAVSG